MAGAFEEEDPCAGTYSHTLPLFVPFGHNLVGRVCLSWETDPGPAGEGSSIIL